MSDSTTLSLVTFEPSRARDVLDKLNREIERVERLEREHTADHVTNAFWTAWHLHEWVWHAIKDDEQLKLAVLKYRGLDGESIPDQAAFGAALAGRFVPLKICRVIATTPKCVRVLFSEDLKPRAASTDVDGIGDSLSNAIRNMTSFDSTPLRLAPAIVIMGRAVAAVRLLREIEEYWLTLIRESGIEQVD